MTDPAKTLVVTLTLGELADACERAAEVVTRGEFRHAESEVG